MKLAGWSNSPMPATAIPVPVAIGRDGGPRVSVPSADALGIHAANASAPPHNGQPETMHDASWVWSPPALPSVHQRCPGITLNIDVTKRPEVSLGPEDLD